MTGLIVRVNHGPEIGRSMNEYVMKTWTLINRNQNPHKTAGIHP